MIPWLGRSLEFPPVSLAMAEPDGLLAAGGDLSVARLLAGYSHGIFPWFSPEDPILWWSPSQRMVVEPGALKVSRSMAKVLRNRRYRVTTDRAFGAVMQACAVQRDEQGGTWITAEMIAAYTELHRQGYAHSFEVWMDDELAGGLYGVAIGGMFYGESMFHRRRDASKIAFIHMAQHLFAHGVGLIDCQMPTAHLASLGARLIGRELFVARVQLLLRCPLPDTVWDYVYDHEPSR